MNKKTLFGLSAILFVLVGTLACSYCSGLYGGHSFDNQSGPVLRAEGDPLPPLPWPWKSSLSSDGGAS